ncbi:dynein light chain roadblock-type 2-like isoform X2 [Sipha flava]|uniref:Dynein light chain roadblock-type 2-like isoform X2 n=1 Tax=Sipha flava TaxID=143950 RepID=A0A8B8FTL6_9HEMI|nr:dynein light chain roadblock-type 2-like isoform X2 [Sipha flava]
MHQPGKPGDIMESTFDNSTSVQYADPIKNLGNKAMSSVRDVDPHNEIILLSMQTKNNEFILAPHKDFTMLVIQDRKK